MNRNSVTASSAVFQAKMDDYRARIDNAILVELTQHKHSVFYEPLVKALQGGKRLRPILLLLSYESVSESREGPLPAAVAVELAHTESLIHDDIIDRDRLRREKAAFHASYGHELALLSADFILSMILNITARYGDPRVAQSLAAATSDMCEGELEELLALRKRSKISGSEYTSIVSKKTASLFEASTAIGAIIAGANEDEVKAFSEYGRLLGIAYQLQDDLVDFEQTASTNLLTRLDPSSGKNGTPQEILHSCLSEAKAKLERLRPNDAKTLLLELADSIVGHTNTPTHGDQNPQTGRCLHELSSS